MEEAYHMEGNKEDNYRDDKHASECVHDDTYSAFRTHRNMEDK